MHSLITLITILLPLFVGFCVRLPPAGVAWVNRGLSWLVYLILVLIGLSLAKVPNLGNQLHLIALTTVWLFVCTIGLNLVVLMVFDHKRPWTQRPCTQQNHKTRVSVSGSLKQVACVLLGLLLGKSLPTQWLPPDAASTDALMLLVFLVGVQLRSSGITLRQVFINRRGVQTAAWFMLANLAAGIVFAATLPHVSWSQGLALSSGYGWYSLSSIVMTEAYGPIWGSIALLNDLAREFFALMFIPFIMRRHPSAGVGIGGATSLDFTLPIIQSSGGIAVVPLAISFGFIVNVVSPILMVFFSTWAF